jgi:hypothetical protein
VYVSEGEVRERDVRVFGSPNERTEVYQSIVMSQRSGEILSLENPEDKIPLLRYGMTKRGVSSKYLSFIFKAMKAW